MDPALPIVARCFSVSLQAWAFRAGAIRRQHRPPPRLQRSFNSLRNRPQTNTASLPTNPRPRIEASAARQYGPIMSDKTKGYRSEL